MCVENILPDAVRLNGLQTVGAIIFIDRVHELLKKRLIEVIGAMNWAICEQFLVVCPCEAMESLTQTIP